MQQLAFSSPTCAYLPRCRQAAASGWVGVPHGCWSRQHGASSSVYDAGKICDVVSTRWRAATAPHGQPFCPLHQLALGAAATGREGGGGGQPGDGEREGWDPAGSARRRGRVLLAGHIGSIPRSIRSLCVVATTSSRAAAAMDGEDRTFLLLLLCTTTIMG